MKWELLSLSGYYAQWVDLTLLSGSEKVTKERAKQGMGEPSIHVGTWLGGHTLPASIIIGSYHKFHNHYPGEKKGTMSHTAHVPLVGSLYLCHYDQVSQEAIIAATTQAPPPGSSPHVVSVSVCVTQYYRWDMVAMYMYTIVQYYVYTCYCWSSCADLASHICYGVIHMLLSITGMKRTQAIVSTLWHHYSTGMVLTGHSSTHCYYY